MRKKKRLARARVPASPLEMLQDPRFGDWLFSRYGRDSGHVVGSFILALEEAGHWPFKGSLLTCLGLLCDTPTVPQPDDVARLLALASEFVAESFAPEPDA